MTFPTARQERGHDRDVTTSLPRGTVHCDASAVEAAGELLRSQSGTWVETLLGDGESQASRALAVSIIDAVLTAPRGSTVDGADIVTDLRTRRAAMRQRVLRWRDSESWLSIVRQRSPLSLIAGCWLDTVSQPATEPAVVVNHLGAHHLALKGDGVITNSLEATRRRALEEAGVHLPRLRASDFVARSEARPLTAVHAAFYLALCRMPASYLPEVVGVHCAYFLLGLDDAMFGRNPAIDEDELVSVLELYAELCAESPSGRADWSRMVNAVSAVVALEDEYLAMLDDLASWQEGLSLDAKVAAIVMRHIPFAGKQHKNIKVGGRLLTEWFADPDTADVEGFLAALRSSRLVRRRADGSVRFLDAIKFGGPMFGIFDAHEAATFAEWIQSIHDGAEPAVDISPCRAGDSATQRWRERVADQARSGRVVTAEAAELDDRELFYRLVNIERFPHVLPLAKQRAEQGLRDAEILFEHGADGRYTDASFFEYSPQALLERAERIYWDKLVEPYRKLDTIPDRDEVIFGQKLTAFGSLIDGAWVHRIGGVGRFDHRADGMLLGIYADEMGRGYVTKNHITLIRRVLASMDIHLPHIRSEEFTEQAELPDIYAFPIHQLSLALFPESFYDEIVGYNLGIEMLGLGEMRLHEIQKLRRWGFDTVYEEAHLTIDNFSAGHARQSVDLITVHLDDIARHSGDAEVRRRWRRVWRGYASFAYFLEVDLVKSLNRTRQLSSEMII
ncbi:iron-containing redox enzyme family protein [Haloechinothrix halophila]|uniref:iron-containing redox enzyme family protein n=1 Tax=Haloechinothrix halophila TaxID=1069073 RepID=UPI0004105D6C|nr:iron-containing redox enzyme family protein [Haloechinothrix halophila]